MNELKTFQEYVLSLKLSPFTAYSEEVTTAIYINYLLQRNVSIQQFANTLAGCLLSPDRLIVDILGKSLGKTCVDVYDSSPPIYINRGWYNACICLLLAAMVLLLISVIIINTKSP